MIDNVLTLKEYDNKGLDVEAYSGRYWDDEVPTVREYHNDNEGIPERVGKCTPMLAMRMHDKVLYLECMMRYSWLGSMEMSC